MITSLISYIYSLFTRSLYSIIGQRQSIIASISNLSTRDRESLLCEVSDCLHWHLSGVGDVGLSSSLEDGHANREYCDSGLAELESLLDQCRKSLEKFESRERFMSVRIQRYRGQLDKRRDKCEIIKDMSDSDHIQLVESVIQIESTKDKYNRDVQALQSVEQMHKNLIAEIEVLRRRIRDLDEKKSDLIDITEECQEFVLAANRSF